MRQTNPDGSAHTSPIKIKTLFYTPFPKNNNNTLVVVYETVT